MSEPVTFKAQLAPVQSGMMLGPDALQVKIIPQSMDAALAGALFQLQESSFKVTVRDTMGDISFNASFPDTRTAISLNKKTPQLQLVIPKGDSLVGLRLFALYGLIFTVEINGEASKPARSKKPAKEAGPYSRFWQLFCAGGAFENRDMWEVLGANNKSEAEAVLRSRFEVTSRTFIEPAGFISWLDVNQLHALATSARRVAAEVGL